jgi:hypothetical protein
MQKSIVRFQVAYKDDPNSLDPWNLEMWGQEILALLDEQYLAPMFVNRDYASEVQRLGQTINARIRGEFKIKRRNFGNAIKRQPLIGTTVPLVLDQMWHCAFVVDDWGATRTFGGIIDDYLRPAAQVLAKGAHASLLGQAPRFLGRRAGELGGLTPTNAVSLVGGFNGAMNAGQEWGGAPLFIDNDTRTTLLNVGQLTKVNEAGDSDVLRRARVGQLFDMDILKTSAVPGNRARAATQTTAANGAKSKGSTTLVVDSDTGIIAGSRISVAGKPYRVVSKSTVTLTIEGGLLEDVADNAVVLVYPTTLMGAAYGAFHAEGVTFDDPIYKGDVIDIADAGGYSTYTVIQVDGTEILLDRTLAAAVSNDALVSIWPAGAYNFGFSENAMLLAVRALPVVPSGLARSIVTSYNGLPIRINMTYDGDLEQVVVNVSMLGGIAKVMGNEGGVLLT